MGSGWDTNIVSLINTSWAQDSRDRPTVKQARTLMEDDIIPTVGELDFGDNSSFGLQNRSAGSMRAPPPQPPLALVMITISDSNKVRSRLHSSVYYFSNIIISCGNWIPEECRRQCRD